MQAPISNVRPRLTTTPFTKQHLSNQMTKQVAIELLKQGNTAEDILSILDVIVADMMPSSVVDFEGNPTEF